MIVDFRYSFGLFKCSKNPATAIPIQNSIYKYGYMDNDMRVNAFSISVGYVIPVFRPKKIVNHKQEVNATVAKPAN